MEVLIAFSEAVLEMPVRSGANLSTSSECLDGGGGGEFPGYMYDVCAPAADLGLPKASSKKKCAPAP